MTAYLKMAVGLAHMMVYTLRYRLVHRLGRRLVHRLVHNLLVHLMKVVLLVQAKADSDLGRYYLV